MDTFQRFLLAREDEERRRRRVMLQTTFPLAFLWLSENDQDVIEEFRQFVHQRLGTLGLAVFDAQLDAVAIKSMVKAAGLGNPTAHRIKITVRRLKNLVVEYGQAVGDPDFLRRAYQAAAEWRRSER